MKTKVCRIQEFYLLSLLIHLTILSTSRATLSSDIMIYKQNGSILTGCTVLAVDAQVRDELALLLEKRSKSIEITLTFEGYDYNPLQDPRRQFYKPWVWVRTTGRQGQALLMLPFNYKTLSFGMLAIGTGSMSVELKDKPAGCLKTLPFEDRIKLLRTFLLNDFKPLSEGLYGSLSWNEYVCVQVLKNVKTYGDFIHDCCRYGPDGDSICIDLTQEFWVTVLISVLTFIKVVIFLFFPLMLPTSFYRPKYVQDQYRVALEKPVNISVYVKDEKIGNDTVRCVKKLNSKQLSLWPKFNRKIRSKDPAEYTIPRNQRVTIPIQNLYLQVQQKQVISKSNVPVSVTSYLYNKFVRCKVRHVDPFTTCCKASICGSYVPKRFVVVSWLQCCQVLVRFLILLLLPLPFYIRLGMYFEYEHEEMVSRKEALEIRGLQEQFTGNFVQYLTPTHSLFIFIYIVCIVEGTGIRLLSDSFRERFKFILLDSFRDMKNINVQENLTKGVKLLLYPLETFGCLGFIIGIFYWLFAGPFLILAAAFSLIPTIYLTWRVVYSFIGIIVELYTRRGKRFSIFQDNKLKGLFQKQKDEMGARDFLPGQFENQNTSDGYLRLKLKPFVREILLQAFVIFCSMAIIYATTTLLVECVGFFVELFVFTLMGIIVNAGQTMRYVSLVFLLWLYMHDCYKSVHQNYVTLATAIIDESVGRVKMLEEMASKSDLEHTNMGFIIKSYQDTNSPSPNLIMDAEHELPRWKLHRPLLFRDNTTSYKPYISMKFFEAFNTTAAGCPGPILSSLLIATRKFLTMVAFLGFVLIVVLTFGDSYNISTTNQTLATVVGGILPWFLRNFVMAKKECVCLSDSGFKLLYDKFVREHSKHWGISDLIIVDPPDADHKWENEYPADVEQPEVQAEEPKEEELEQEGPLQENRTIGHVTTLKTRGDKVKVKPVDLLIDLSHDEKDVEFVHENKSERVTLNMSDTSDTSVS